MNFPLIILLALYLFAVLIIIFFDFIIAYHLIRYGLITLTNLFILFFFLGITVGILLISWTFIGQIDWSQSVPIFFSTQSSFF